MIDEEQLLNDLEACLYKRDGQYKASVASIKHLINRVSGYHRYCITETRKSRLPEM